MKKTNSKRSANNNLEDFDPELVNKLHLAAQNRKKLHI